MNAVRPHDALDYRAFFEYAPDAIFVGEHALGVTRLTDVNPAGSELVGYSREELAGMKLSELCPESDAAQMQQVKEIMRLGGTAMKEKWMCRKDGTLLRVEAKARMLDDDRVLVFIRDISARKHAEHEREETFRWLRAVLDQCPAGVILLHGENGHRVEVNLYARRIFGRDADDTLGYLGAVLALDGRPLELHELPVWRALAGETVVGVEILGRRPNGSTVPMIAAATPLVCPNGEVHGAIGVFQDISARAELDRLRAEWASVVAHDLRQPLGSISLTAQTLARGTTDAKVEKGLERILRSANRLNRMVGDLMDLSRIDAHRLEILPDRVDIPALVRGSIERMALEAKDRSFDVRVQGEIPQVCADSDRVTQVMENLLTNAVKYGTPGTPVAVTITLGGQEISVAVTNHGRSLTAEEIGQLFERFHRTDAAKRSGIRGVGLGLYITRSLVEAHGGHLVAESSPAGANTFRFTLPVTEGECVVPVTARSGAGARGTAAAQSAASAAKPRTAVAVEASIAPHLPRGS
jgi:PAS domain S-box-containing protein